MHMCTCQGMKLRKKSVFPLDIGVQFPEAARPESLPTGYYELGLH